MYVRMHLEFYPVTLFRFANQYQYESIEQAGMR